MSGGSRSRLESEHAYRGTSEAGDQTTPCSDKLLTKVNMSTDGTRSLGAASLGDELARISHF